MGKITKLINSLRNEGKEAEAAAAEIIWAEHLASGKPISEEPYEAALTAVRLVSRSIAQHAAQSAAAAVSAAPAVGQSPAQVFVGPADVGPADVGPADKSEPSDNDIVMEEAIADKDEELDRHEKQAVSTVQATIKYYKDERLRLRAAAQKRVKTQAAQIRQQDTTIAKLRQNETENEKKMNQLQESHVEKDASINNLRQSEVQNQATIAELHRMAEVKDDVIRDLRREKGQNMITIADQQAKLRQHETLTMSAMRAEIRKHETQNQTEVAKPKFTLVQKEDSIKALVATNARLEQELRDKDQLIARMRELNDPINKREEN